MGQIDQRGMPLRRTAASDEEHGNLLRRRDRAAVGAPRHLVGEQRRELMRQSLTQPAVLVLDSLAEPCSILGREQAQQRLGIITEPRNAEIGVVEFADYRFQHPAVVIEICDRRGHLDYRRVELPLNREPTQAGRQQMGLAKARFTQDQCDTRVRVRITRAGCADR